MSTIDTSGPAFPVPEMLSFDGSRHEVQWHGMSLRDWFAGRAMEALVGDPALLRLDGMESRLARASYLMADEMLKARECAERGE